MSVILERLSIVNYQISGYSRLTRGYPAGSSSSQGGDGPRHSTPIEKKTQSGRISPVTQGREAAGGH